MDNCYTNIGAVKTIEIDGELYISCWNFSKALGEKEREISDLCKENDKLQKQISELESELSVKEDLLKIKNAYSDKDWEKDLKAMVNFGVHVDKETLKEFADLKEKGKVLAEPLPFSDEEYEEEIKTELPAAPIDVASMLINEKNIISKCSFFPNGFEPTFEVLSSKKYSKNDLREIAEHLLVYCNNPDEGDDDTQS